MPGFSQTAPEQVLVVPSLLRAKHRAGAMLRCWWRGGAQQWISMRLHQADSAPHHCAPASVLKHWAPKKASGGPVPGRTTKTGGHWGPAVVKWEIIRTDLLHVQNILFFLWQAHNSQCNYPSGWGAREKTQKGQHDGVQEKQGRKNVKKRKILRLKTTDLKFTTSLQRCNRSPKI